MRHVAGTGGEELMPVLFGGETEGKRPLERPRQRWEHYIEMKLREMRWENMG